MDTPSFPPKRIISTVPSLTELLYDLGLEQEVVGITAWCVHPRHWLEEKTVIGGTKDLKLEKIRELQPDLIIANKEENIKEQIEELQRDFPVYVTNVTSLESAFKMILEVGTRCGKSEPARQIVDRIQSGFRKLPQLKAATRFLFFIWKEPYMVAGKDTFISHMMEFAGFENAAPESPQRYPELNDLDIKSIKAELLILTSEPYNFSSGELHDMQKQFGFKLALITNGENLSWYGSRMLKATDTLNLTLKNINSRI